MMIRSNIIVLDSVPDPVARENGLLLWLHPLDGMGKMDTVML